MAYCEDLAEMYVGKDVSPRLLRLGIPQIRSRRRRYWHNEGQ
jgi:hypothetical protein